MTVGREGLGGRALSTVARGTDPRGRYRDRPGPLGGCRLRTRAAGSRVLLRDPAAHSRGRGRPRAGGPAGTLGSGRRGPRPGRVRGPRRTHRR